MNRALLQFGFWAGTTQALALLNSPLVQEQAAAFAKRLRAEAPGNDAGAIARAWQLAFGRPPTSVETERAIAFLRERTTSAGVSGRSGGREDHALAEFCLALFNANEFIYVD